MKKLLILALALITLTACSSNKTVYKNDVDLYKIGSTTTRESDYYNFLKVNDKAISIYSDIVTQINSESGSLTKYAARVDETVTLEIANLKENFGDQVDLMIQNAGFESIEDFIENQLRPSLALQFEMQDYIINNLDEVTAKYGVKDVSIFATDDSELATEIQIQLNEGVNPSEIEIEKKATLTETLISKSYDSKSELVNKELSSDKNINTAVSIYDKEANITYIVYKHDTDLSGSVDGILGLLVENEDYTTEYTKAQFKANNFKIYDNEVKGLFKTLKPGFLN